MSGIPPPPPPPPPPPGMLDAPPGSMTIKKKIATKYKLPNLNWTSLKPGQVRDTVFSELDDEKYFKVNTNEKHTTRTMVRCVSSTSIS
jgi:formic-like protein